MARDSSLCQSQATGSSSNAIPSGEKETRGPRERLCAEPEPEDPKETEPRPRRERRRRSGEWYRRDSDCWGRGRGTGAPGQGQRQNEHRGGDLEAEASVRLRGVSLDILSNLNFINAFYPPPPRLPVSLNP